MKSSCSIGTIATLVYKDKRINVQDAQISVGTTALGRPYFPGISYLYTNLPIKRTTEGGCPYNLTTNLGEINTYAFVVGKIDIDNYCKVIE